MELNSKHHLASVLDHYQQPTDERHTQCVEHSTASKKAWYEALQHGCLNKSTNEKLRLFSYLRALSDRKLGKSNISNAIGQRLFDDPSLLGNEDVDTEDEEPMFDEETLDPPLSPVIAEDFSKPPQVTEETSPSFFSTNEFFQYLCSPQWKGNISLRVIGGELLTLLLTALFVLERKRLLNRHVTYANLNNRRRVEVQQQEHSTKDKDSCQMPVSEPPSEGQKLDPMMSVSRNSEDFQKAKARIPNPYETSKGLEYETLSLQLVYYEKPDMSSIPWVSEITCQPNDSPQLVPEPREVFPKPYVYKQHCINRVRLPANEDIDPKEKIANLQNELDRLEEAKIYSSKEEEEKIKLSKEKSGKPVKDSKVTKDNKDTQDNKVEAVKEKKVQKDNLTGGDVEWIASEPFLHKESERKPTGAFMTASKKKLESDSLKEMGPQTLAGLDESRKGTTVGEGPLSSLHVPTKISVEHVAEDKDSESLVMVSSLSSGGSYAVIKSERDILSDAEEEEPILKELNLSGNELYVTGLYAARDENERPADEMLKKRNLVRKNKRSLTAASVMKSVEMKVPFDIHSRFKTLATAKEAARRKATGPRIPQESTRQMSKKEHYMTDWSRYLRDHEECEIDVALKNKLEKGVLERMLTTPGKDLENPVDEAQKNVTGKKGKDKKNKTQNNALDMNINRHLNSRNHRHYMTNYNDRNDSAKEDKKSKCQKASWLYEKLPPVRNERGHYSPANVSVKPDVSCKKVPVFRFKDVLSETLAKRPGVNVSGNQLTATGKEGRYSDTYLERCSHFRKQNTPKQPNVLPKTVAFSKYYRKASQSNIRSHHLKADINGSSPGINRNKGSHSNQIDTDRKITLLNTNFSANSDIEQSRHSLSSVGKKVSSPKLSLKGDEDFPVEKEETFRSESDENSKSEINAAKSSSLIFPNFNCECSCFECAEQDSILADLRPRDKCELLNKYPLTLGKLTRDFRFLDKKDYQPKSVDGSKPPITRFGRPDVSSVCSHLLNMINDVLIRKDILTSSLGHTYITVIFHKAGRSE